jgi:aminodeoxyfutalosine deaminase
VAHPPSSDTLRSGLGIYARPSVAEGAVVGHQQPVSPDRLAALPKVELHLHLEGTIAPAQAAALARRHGLDPAVVLGLEGGRYPRRYRDFDHFLQTFLGVSALVRTPEDLHDVTATLAEDRRRQGIAYSEVTFTAATHVRAGMDPAAMWEALRTGLDTVPEVRIGLIVDVVRDDGATGVEQTVALVEAADAPIVGLGLSGTEDAAPAATFGLLRTAADRLGFGLSVHAGETGPASHVRAAVEDLGADRIGHGIAAAHEPALLDLLARRGVVLEVCPSSNLALGLVDSLDAHPLPVLHDAGVTVAIGSDDPPFFHTTLTEELGHAARLLGGHEDLVADLQVAAARAAFAPVAVRTELEAAVEAWRVSPGG